jgi:hypothetical protein
MVLIGLVRKPRLFAVLSFACMIGFGVSTSRDQPDTIDAEFNRTYNGETSPGKISVFKYNISAGQVARVHVESTAAKEDFPLLVVVREQKAILSWQVPLVVQNLYMYNSVGRTLCPSNVSQHDFDVKLPEGDPMFQRVAQEGAMIFKNMAPSNDMDLVFGGATIGASEESSAIDIELSSYSRTPLPYELRASLLTDFKLSLEKPHTFDVSPSTPRYFRFDFPKNVDSVIVYVSSTDKLCMVFSVQPITCPVFDLDTNIEFTGMYQTITLSGAITVQKNYFKGLQADHGIQLLPRYRNSFYAVFVVKPTNYKCSGLTVIPPKDPIPESMRNKNVTVRIVKTIGEEQYIVATLTVVACFLGVYFFVIALSLIFHVSEQHIPSIKEERRAVVASLTNIATTSPVDPSTPVGTRYGSVDLSTPPNNGVLPTSPGPPARDMSDSEASEYDDLSDAASDKNVIRRKPNLTVADLARKPHKALSKKYKLYHWNLITISIFYGLPVVQLVLTFQAVLYVTGNEDFCYYNFKCAHPLWIFTAFNNVYSNIGYIMLGLLFLILVRNRERYHKRGLEENFTLETKYGIPRHFGLFYAMGIALAMEGVLSACYHVCPSYSNFQFDTAFMYIIGCLGVLKIYQIRHPDINAHAHVAYCVMALIILLAVVGVVYGGTPFWIVFSICFILLMVAISIEFYYKGQWKLNRYMFQQIRTEWQSNINRRWFLPLYPERMIFLVLMNVMNLAYISWGLATRPADFPSYLLAIVISNLLLYCVYYFILKLVHRERIWVRPIIYIVLSVVSWAFSLYFFMAGLTSWMKSPAQSRTHNRDCIFLDFFDAHDVWHFLSSISLFLSFMAVLTLDDDLVYVPQDKIAAF